MGIKNYLIEGISGTGKTSVCDDAVTTPSMVTVSCLIKAIQRLVNRWTVSDMNTTSGMWTKSNP